MILPINDKYRIAGDEHCWAIQQPRVRKRRGEVVTEWESVRWYPSIETCAQSLCHLMVRTSDAHTLADALSESENAVATLCQALAPASAITRAIGGGRND